MESFDPTPDGGAPAAFGPTHGGESCAPAAAKRRAKRHEPPRSANPATPVKLSLSLELSPASTSSGYAPRYIDSIALNTTAQRVTLKLVTATLMAREAVLLDGTRVKHPQQAIQWLLEEIAVGLPQPVLDALMEAAE